LSHDCSVLVGSEKGTSTTVSLLVGDYGRAQPGVSCPSAGAHPLDESVSAVGRTLYVLVDGRHTIAGYRIGADGSLSALGETGSLPAGAVGLVSS
jgi:hypothetical protein